MELIHSPIKGVYRDILQGPDGQLIWDRGWQPNTIVADCRVLLARLIESNAIHHMAFGQGLEAWDKDGAPAPDDTTAQLEDKLYQTVIDKKDLNITYLDDNDQEVKDRPTNRLQITATLGQNYPAPIPPETTYPLREFGLFGQHNNQNYMINCVRHPVIPKGAATTLIRVVRLYF